MKNFIGGVFSLIVIFVFVKLLFGIGQATQEAAYQPVASDDPRLAMNGGDCDVIMTFPEGTSEKDKQAEATFFLVRNTDETQRYRWDALPNGDYCISPSIESDQL